MPKLSRRDQDSTTPQRYYCKPEHRGLHIASAVFLRVGEAVYIQYNIRNGERNQKCPRSLSGWLDGHGDVFIRSEIDAWKRRTNGDLSELAEFEPPAFQRDKQDFIAWMSKSAGPATQQEYLRSLRQAIFPFFVSAKGQNDPARWANHYSSFYDFLDSNYPAAQTRNHIKTAANRYLHFLREKRGFHGALIMPMERIRRSRQDIVFIPSARLPTYPELAEWFDSLYASSMERWTLLLMVAFGVRFGEALAATPGDLLGGEDVPSLEGAADTIQRVLRDYRPSAFLQVSRSIKRPLKNKDLLRAGKEHDEEPKSGPYIAACFSLELAERVASLCEEFTENPLPSEPDYVNTYFNVVKLIQNGSAFGPLKFDLYTPHDFRRLSVTMKVIETQNTFAVARLHGHGEDVSKRYLQKGLELQRRSGARKFTPIKPQSA